MIYSFNFSFYSRPKTHKTFATVGKTKSFLLKNSEYETKTLFTQLLGSKYIPIKADKIFEYKNNGKNLFKIVV